MTIPPPRWPKTMLLQAAGGAWSFAGKEPRLLLEYFAAPGIAVARDRAGRVRFESADPFAALRWMQQTVEEGDTRDRWVGFIGYEFARCVEALPASTADDQHLPTFAFALCEPAEISSIQRPSAAAGAPTLSGRSMSRDAYLSRVRRAIDYIGAGDIFQVNLAQRFSFQTQAAPADVFGALSPATYGALLDFDGYAILSNSPELFFRVDPLASGRRIVNRPIKGTRPRRPGMKQELESSAKDRAELAMIVDLQRNDLGRVCEIGSVMVTCAREIETHPTVYHGVATVEGRLRADAGFADIVRALFPCGSITGCPKVRAMQIIDELEPVARGPYCGAIGYVAADGTMEFNVAIRTMTIIDCIAHVSVGGGIVADSEPQAEYDETIVKARAMLDALGLSSEAQSSLANDRMPCPPEGNL